MAAADPSPSASSLQMPKLHRDKSRVIKHCHWLPGEAVAAPLLDVCKARLDLEQPGLAHGRGWNEMSFKVPFNPKYFVIQ